MADQIIQEIKDRLDIADVIGSYIPIKKAGVNFKALCPFHGEKTPSFVITPSRQIWHCFGCGEGGDVFSFVQKFENLDFLQTLKILADRAGVKLPEYKPGQNLQEDEKELLIRINTFAARFYHQALLHESLGKMAREYLAERGITEEIIKKWQIGFAPDDFKSLGIALKQKNVKEIDAIKAGVLIKNERAQVYDRFRGRITFPIFNYIGEIVGFSARILPKLDDGKSGKYINSPETLIYNKSKVLFGLSFAKNEIRKQNEVIIVEGQMDCISAHMAGFTNTVASSGTAMTMEHLTLLSRLTKNLKFCFDADSAGLNATKKVVEHILGKDFNIKIVIITGAKDPDELIRQNPKAWDKAVKQAPLFLDYYIDKLFENFSATSVERKKEIKEEIFPLIEKLTDSLEQDHYLQILAAKFGTVINVLKQSMKKTGRAEAVKQDTKQKVLGVAGGMDLVAEAQKLVLGGMLSDQKFLNLVLREGILEDFTDLQVKQIAEVLFANQALSQELLNSTLAKEAVFMLNFSKEESASEEAFLKDLTNAFFALRNRTLKQLQAKLQLKIQEAEKQKDFEAIQDLQKDFFNTSKLIQKYNQHG